MASSSIIVRCTVSACRLVMKSTACIRHPPSPGPPADCGPGCPSRHDSHVVVYAACRPCTAATGTAAHDGIRQRRVMQPPERLEIACRSSQCDRASGDTYDVASPVRPETNTASCRSSVPLCDRCRAPRRTNVRLGHYRFKGLGLTSPRRSYPQHQAIRRTFGCRCTTVVLTHNAETRDPIAVEFDNPGRLCPHSKSRRGPSPAVCAGPSVLAPHPGPSGTRRCPQTKEDVTLPARRPAGFRDHSLQVRVVCATGQRIPVNHRSAQRAITKRP